jgi:hypothetical protein
MDPALAAFIRDENSKRRNRFFDNHEFFVFHMHELSEIDKRVETELEKAVNLFKSENSEQIASAEMTIREMSRNRIPIDLRTPPDGWYWYIVLTLTEQGKPERERLYAELTAKLYNLLSRFKISATLVDKRTKQEMVEMHAMYLGLLN